MRPAESVMEAYYRRRGEDRATELLATVLDGSPTLRRELARHLELPEPSTVEIETQRSIPPDSRIDLEIAGRGAEGEPLWLVWSEHKLRARFSHGQLKKYATALPRYRTEVPARILIAITLGEPNAEVMREAGDHGVTLLRWSTMLGLVQSAGAAIAGSSWRTRNIGGEAEAERRLLREWTDFADLDDEMESPVEPLTAADVELLPRVEQLEDTLSYLTEEAFRAACGRVGGASLKEVDEGWHAQGPRDSWLHEFDALLYLNESVDDSKFATAPTGKPVFAAGIFCEGSEAAELKDRVAVPDSIFDASEFTGRKRYFDIGYTIPMADVALSGDLESQVALLADFCESSFRSLLAIGIEQDLGG